MRMFRLPWISESRRVEEPVHEAKPADMESASTSKRVDNETSAGRIPTGKRPRDHDDLLDGDTKISEAQHPNKRPNLGTSAYNHRRPGYYVKRLNAISDNLSDPAMLARVRDIIDTQFGLEILLKHEELEGIKQELAKSQAALEQLRRCHLIPFPTSCGDPQLNISTGTGYSIPQTGGSRPRWAPPFGVTEGPYSRHYSKWLIPDPQFDGVQPEPYRMGDATRGAEGRMTRNSFALETPAAKPRRGTAGQKHQALPSGYAPAKETAGPSLVKRADGQLVKLVCIDCERENFGSTQGFINHCRIAHRREFKSHEEAAVQSGHVVDGDQSANVAREDKLAVAPGLVHPMIRSPPTEHDAIVAVLSHIRSSTELFYSGKLAGITAIPGSEAASPRVPRRAQQSKSFVPAPATPHLSDLLRTRGFAKNLGAIVTEAQRKSPAAELCESGDSDDESEMGLDGDGAVDSAHAARLPARSAGVLPFVGRAGDEEAQRRHEVPSSDDDEREVSMADITELSPATMASNNAPSLVSDDGEYSAGEDAETETETDSEGEESEVAEIEVDDEDKVVARTVRVGKMGKMAGKGERHVGFVSPVKRKGGRGKARK